MELRSLGDTSEAELRKRFTRVPIRIDTRGGRREVWIVNNPQYCGKILEIMKGRRCSFHFHILKTESFYLRCGHLRIRIKQSVDAGTICEFELREGECMDIQPGLVHQMQALEDSELYEFSTQHFESDSYR